ncbi:MULTISPECIES: LysR family transcriptional regulator [Campylobacter]|uniref:LysR family transcriptional regulator n=1 Tax=Campylobacter TaxID=194 RepID=UPI00192F7F92|nr:MULTISPECIES: LysR family transcriptional regulator [Campylobacter]MDV2490882.1 LysR family transcriptional regulator [Campylobacter sp. TJR-1]
MTIKQIEHFLKLYELNNVSLAAKEFDISQSALSNSLKELENSLNGNLFDRIGKNLIINQKGKAFYEQILPVYLNLKNIEIKMRYNGLLNLNLLSSQNIGNYLLPTVLNDLLGKFNMTLSIKNTAKIVDNILNHKCDLGFIESNIHNKNISKLKICEDELIVVCADKNYQNKECYIDEISDKKWILREDGSALDRHF